MRSIVFTSWVAAALLLATSVPARAQWVVYDPTNYAQALTLYAQAVQQYEFLLRQAKRLPADAASRYRIPETPWRDHPADVPLLAGLNTGEQVATAYREAVGPLDPMGDILGRTPEALRNRLTGRYGVITLADSIAKLGIQQAGSVRGAGAAVLRAIQAMEDDASAGSDEYHSQTALLNKINSASVLGLRIAEQGTQFMAHTLEQLLLDNLRKRESEVQLMNAHAYRSRYGDRYGAEMFDKTAQRLDTWRQP